jgi:beta-glucosidase
MVADQKASQRLDAYLNCQYLDPAILGEVPSELPDMFGAAWPSWTDEELERVRQAVDFVGVNYYLRLVVRNDPEGGPAQARPVRQTSCPHTAMDWEIYAQGLTDTLLWVKQRYGNVPQYITENGAAFDDLLDQNLAVHDGDRVKYLNDHLIAARRALEAGVDLRGYFLWSLLDNFEWQCGHSKRFGIVRVDFESQRRIPKDSARFYSNVIRSNGTTLGV